jgi:hypothetical protein
MRFFNTEGPGELLLTTTACRRWPLKTWRRFWADPPEEVFFAARPAADGQDQLPVGAGRASEPSGDIPRGLRQHPGRRRRSARTPTGRWR